ncbi:hypothetical protein HY995_00175 [Candidatus Micrarchaeota archaeon]|nr:hypothetical protein [Candidatus Micrarchaeota archaeon]
MYERPDEETRGRGLLFFLVIFILGAGLFAAFQFRLIQFPLYPSQSKDVSATPISSIAQNAQGGAISDQSQPTSQSAAVEPAKVALEDEVRVGNSVVTLSHTLETGDFGRIEQISFENKGTKQVNFRVLEIIPDEISAGGKELLFADESSNKILGFKVVVRDFSLNPTEKKGIRLESGSKSEVGAMFVVITDPQLDLEAVKTVLEREISEAKKAELISLRAQDAEGFRKEIQDLLNDQGISSSERIGQLRQKVAKEQTQVFEGPQPTFPKTISEIQPAALFVIPVSYPTSKEKPGDLLYKVTGDISAFSKATLQADGDGTTSVEVFADISGVPLKNGLIWNEAENKQSH